MSLNLISLGDNRLVVTAAYETHSRLDQLVEFELPGRPERERILLQYFEEHIAKPATSGELSRLRFSGSCVGYYRIVC